VLRSGFQTRLLQLRKASHQRHFIVIVRAMWKASNPSSWTLDPGQLSKNDDDEFVFQISMQPGEVFLPPWSFFASARVPGSYECSADRGFLFSIGDPFISNVCSKILLM